LNVFKYYNANLALELYLILIQMLIEKHEIYY